MKTTSLNNNSNVVPRAERLDTHSVEQRTSVTSIFNEIGRAFSPNTDGKTTRKLEKLQTKTLTHVKRPVARMNNCWANSLLQVIRNSSVLKEYSEYDCQGLRTLGSRETKTQEDPGDVLSQLLAFNKHDIKLIGINTPFALEESKEDEIFIQVCRVDSGNKILDDIPHVPTKGLASCIIHLGETSEVGHYVTLINKKGVWKYIDGKKVFEWKQEKWISHDADIKPPTKTLSELLKQGYIFHYFQESDDDLPPNLCNRIYDYFASYFHSKTD